MSKTLIHWRMLLKLLRKTCYEFHAVYNVEKSLSKSRKFWQSYHLISESSFLRHGVVEGRSCSEARKQLWVWHDTIAYDIDFLTYPPVG